MKQLLYLLLFCSCAITAQEQKYILLDSLTAHYQVKQYTLDTSPYGTKNSIEVYNVFSKKYETDKGEDFILLFSVLPDIDSKTNWEKIDFNKIKDNLFPTKEIFRRIMHKALGFYLDKNRDISKTKLVKIIKGEYYVSKYCWIEDFYCINDSFPIPIATKSFILNVNQPITPIGALRDFFRKLSPLCQDFPFEQNTDSFCGIPDFLKNTYLSNIEERGGDMIYCFYQFYENLHTNISRFGYVKGKGIVAGVYFNHFMPGPFFIDKTGNWRKLKRLPENELLWAEELKKEWAKKEEERKRMGI